MEKGNKKFYITTAIPYVNAKPHIGHALEFVQSDVIARWHRQKGEEVMLLSGSDENALKNVHAAEAAGFGVQEFIDANAESFLELAQKLNVQFDAFQKGSDHEHHFPSSQKLWKLCEVNGDIYKKSYEGLYCVGCETFYAKDELTENGECPEHPGRKLDIVSEENYFFKLSRYQEQLIALIESEQLVIVPRSRRNEMLSFLKEPLQDISISRSNARAKNWGVPVPGDPEQRIYVWFDALNIYQSGVGFGWDDERYKKWWPADVHVIGKGIIRFHAIYWPAFLLSAGLPLPKSLFVHGYITIDGQKMSKTIGNVVDPFELIETYGADPVRYYLLREIPSGDDGDFSYEKFEQRYNGDLANGLGNLVSRVATLAERASPLSGNFADCDCPEKDVKEEISRVRELCQISMNEQRLNEALGHAWELISFSDRYINEKKPWAIKDDELLFRHVIANACYLVDAIAELAAPFIPETSRKVQGQISFDQEKSEITIQKSGNLFPRLG